MITNTSPLLSAHYMDADEHEHPLSTTSRTGGYDEWNEDDEWDDDDDDDDD